MEDLHLRQLAGARGAEAFDNVTGIEPGCDGRQETVAAIDLPRTRVTLDEQHAQRRGVSQRQREGRAADSGADHHHVKPLAVHAGHGEALLTGTAAGASTLSVPGSQRSSTGVVSRGSSPSSATGSSPWAPSIRTQGLV